MKSVGERGTLSQLKQDFGHRGVKNDVMNAFNHDENFTCFVTESHVIYLALQQCAMNDIDSILLESLLLLADQVPNYINSVSRCIVDTIWCMPSLGTLQEVLESKLPPGLS